MDDDDILLDLPELNEHSVIEGLQYIPRRIENFGYQDLSDCDIDVDFSGHIVDYSIVNSYFLNRTEPINDIMKAASVMEDCTFMNYLKGYNPYRHSTPFVYERNNR